MNEHSVHIDFQAMATALKTYVRRKAQKAESTIVYIENGQLIEENPQLHTKVAIKKVAANT